MSEPSIVVQTLQNLGLTRIEAEVYLATLQEFDGGPVSGYRVAQSVGKDPANLSKTLASLEILGAVRTIQEKPRLYIPIAPDEFTGKLIADMESNRQHVLKQMKDLKSNLQKGIPLALNSQKQALKKASELMSQCRRELLLFADTKTLKKMGTDLEALAVSSDVRVRLLCIDEFTQPGVEETIIDVPVGFADPEPIPWLQMIVDRQSWLTATFPPGGADTSPCGWWSEDAALALVFGASLTSALDGQVREAVTEISGASVIGAVTEGFVPETEVQQIIEEPVEELIDEQFTKEMPPQPIDEPETISQEPSSEDNDDDDDGGIQFIIRHDEDE